MYEHHSSNGSNTAGKPKYKVNEALVEIDGWRLVKCPLWPALVRCESYIVHMACREGDTGRLTVRGRTKKGNIVCVRCGMTPPDEILGLEILHNGKV